MSLETAATLAVIAAGVGTIGTFVIAYFSGRETRQLARDTQRLAAATVDLSRATTEMASATQEANRIAREQVAAAMGQVEATNRVLAASMRPFITQLTDPKLETNRLYHFNDRGADLGLGGVYVGPLGPHGIDLSVPFRNTGVGTALLTGVGVNARPDVGWGGHFNRAVLAPGEVGRMLSTIPPDRPELQHLLDALQHGGAVVVSIGYTDGAGRAQPTTQLHLSPAVGGWLVRQTLVGDLGDEPLFGTGPAEGYRIPPA